MCFFRLTGSVKKLACEARQWAWAARQGGTLSQLANQTTLFQQGFAASHDHGQARQVHCTRHHGRGPGQDLQVRRLVPADTALSLT